MSATGTTAAVMPRSAVAPLRPISLRRCCSESLSSFPSGRLRKSSMRRCKVVNARKNALRFSSSLPSTAAGSSTPQCAVIGWPGHRGQDSPAALSHTVKTKSSSGAPGCGELVPALAAQPFDREPVLLQQLDRERIDAAVRMRTGGIGLEARRAHGVHHDLGENRARRVSGAQEEDIQGLVGRHGSVRFQLMCLVHAGAAGRAQRGEFRARLYGRGRVGPA